MINPISIALALLQNSIVTTSGLITAYKLIQFSAFSPPTLLSPSSQAGPDSQIKCFTDRQFLPEPLPNWAFETTQIAPLKLSILQTALASIKLKELSQTVPHPLLS